MLHSCYKNIAYLINNLPILNSRKNDSSQGDENPVNDDEQFDSVEEEKKTIPDHIKLTEAIMLRSAHFLPSKETQQQINIMQVIKYIVFKYSSLSIKWEFSTGFKV